MRILGLDCSLTATGYAIIEPNGVCHVSGVIRTKPEDWRDNRIGRCVQISDMIMATCPITNTLVAIEGYAFAGNRGHDLGELGGIVRYRIREKGIDFVEIPPGEWRKKILGKGNAHKDEVRLGLFKKYKVEFKDLNTAEAYGVAMCAHEYLSEREGLSI